MIISASKTCQLSLLPHKALLRRETFIFPPVLFAQACDFPPWINDPSHYLLSLASVVTPFLPLAPSGLLRSQWTQVSVPSGSLPRWAQSSFPLPLKCTHRAAQTIWFHCRSNPCHSLSHSAPGLCKTPLGLTPALSQHHEPPRTQTSVFGCRMKKPAHLFCPVLRTKGVWDTPSKDSKT